MRIKTRRPGEGIILRRHTLLYGLKYCTRRSFARKQRNSKHSRRVRRDRETILTADATVSETIIRSTRAHFQDVEFFIEFRFHSNVYTGTVTRVLSFYRSNTETIHVLRSTEYSRQFRAYSNNDRGAGGGTRGGLNGNGGKIHGGEKGIARKT